MIAAAPPSSDERALLHPLLVQPVALRKRNDYIPPRSGLYLFYLRDSKNFIVTFYDFDTVPALIQQSGHLGARKTSAHFLQLQFTENEAEREKRDSFTCKFISVAINVVEKLNEIRGFFSPQITYRPQVKFAVTVITKVKFARSDGLR